LLVARLLLQIKDYVSSVDGDDDDDDDDDEQLRFSLSGQKERRGRDLLIPAYR